MKGRSHLTLTLPFSPRPPPVRSRWSWTTTARIRVAVFWYQHRRVNADVCPGQLQPLTATDGTETSKVVKQFGAKWLCVDHTATGTRWTITNPDRTSRLTRACLLSTTKASRRTTSEKRSTNMGT